MRYSLELVPPIKSQPLPPWVNEVITKIRGTFDFLTIVDKAMRHDPIETAIALREQFSGTIIPHLTLRNRTKKEVEDMIARMREAGIKKVLALKGDTEPSGEFSDVSELIAFLKKGGMEVGAALNPRAELAERLQQKITAGASFFITQPIWDNEKLIFLDKLSFGDVKIVPTLLILNDHKKLAEYALKYPDMGIPESYLAQHTRESVSFSITHARKLIAGFTARDFDWIHLMGDLQLILNLFSEQPGSSQ